MSLKQEGLNFNTMKGETLSPSLCPVWKIIYIKIYLFVSSLVFGSFKKFSVLVLAHLLLSPLYDTTHPCTSFLICN